MRTTLRWDWLRFAVGAWMALTAGIVVHAFLFPTAHSMYPIYAPAARRWWLGDDIYVPLVEYFRYSPLFAIFFSCLTWLPDGVGNALWKALNIGIYTFGLRAVARGLPSEKWSRNQHASFWLLALPLSLHSMYNGQANCTMVGLMLLGVTAARRPGCLAGLSLAAAALIKTWALGLGLLLAAISPRRLTPWLAAGLALGLAAPLVTQPPGVVIDQYASWGRHLRMSAGLNRERQRSIDYLLHCYGLDVEPETFTGIGIAAAVILMGWTWRSARGPAERRPHLMRVYQGFALWVVLFGPATEACTYVVLAPAVAWNGVEQVARRAPGWRIALVLVSVFLMGPAVSDLVGPFRNFATTHASQPIGAVAFGLHCLWPFRAQRTQGAVDATPTPGLRWAA